MTRLEHVNYIFGNFSRRQTEDNCSIKMNSAKAQIRCVLFVLKITTAWATALLWWLFWLWFRDFPKETSMTEEFICGHCKRQLVDPKVLPCLHSFCTECIQKLLTKQQRKTGSQSSYSVRSHGKYFPWSKALLVLQKEMKNPAKCNSIAYY